MKKLLLTFTALIGLTAASLSAAHASERIWVSGNVLTGGLAFNANIHGADVQLRSSPRYRIYDCAPTPPSQF